MRLCTLSCTSYNWVWLWVKSTWPMFNWFVIIFLHCKSSWYILDTILLSNVCFVNVFPSLWTFIFLVVSFKEQKILIFLRNFLFWTNFRAIKKVAKIVQTVLFYSSPHCPNINILYNLGTMTGKRKLTLVLYHPLNFLFKIHQFSH